MNELFKQWLQHSFYQNELADETWICVRPSGTEPKIKFYIGTKGKNPDTYAHFITEWVKKFSYVM